MRIIKEGKASIRVFEGVFYNPMAAFSRTVGVVALTAFSMLKGRSMVVADAMAATGIRGIRYFLESVGIDKIIFNDKMPYAYENIKYNVELNKISNYEIYKYDTNLFNELVCRNKVDIIDVDPFGSPSPYIDSLVRAVKHRGMIIISATDLTALCGIYPNAAFRKYFSYVYKNDFCHETALRILIKELVIAGGRNNKYVYPFLSMFSEQYARIYAYVISAKRVPKENIGYIYEDLSGFKVIHNPSQLKSNRFIGPLWTGPLHDIRFIEYFEKALSITELGNSEVKRLKKLIEILKKEVSLPPYSYRISKLASKLKIPQPKINKIIELLESAGYLAGRSHMGKDLLKTNAPIQVIEDLLLKLAY